MTELFVFSFYFKTIQCWLWVAINTYNFNFLRTVAKRALEYGKKKRKQEWFLSDVFECTDNDMSEETETPKDESGLGNTIE